MANAVTRALAWPLIGLVKLYRVAISPWLGMNCRYQPTCSEYAIEALREHGVFRGRIDSAQLRTTQLLRVNEQRLPVNIGRCRPHPHVIDRNTR